MIFNLSKTIFPKLETRCKKLFFILFRLPGVLTVSGCTGVGRTGEEVRLGFLVWRLSRCLTIFFFIFSMFFSSTARLFLTYLFRDLADPSLVTKQGKLNTQSHHCWINLAQVFQSIPPWIRLIATLDKCSGMWQLLIHCLTNRTRVSGLNSTVGRGFTSNLD